MRYFSEKNRLFSVLFFCIFLLMLFSGCTSPQSESHGVISHYNIPYIDDGLEKHRLDLFLPAHGLNFPLLVFVHGGGWHWGDRQALIDVYGDIGRSWAGKGLAVAVISYRLGDDHPIWEQLGDVAAAIAWTYKNGPEYGADPNRFFVCGHSAGAHLAAMTVFDPKWLAVQGQSPNIFTGAIFWSGLYNVPDAIAEAGSFARRKIWYSVFGEDKQVWEAMSPIRHITSQKSVAPPVLMIIAEKDIKVIKRQSAAFAEKLRQSEKKVQEVTLAGQGHFSEVFSADLPDGPLFQQISLFTGSRNVGGTITGN